MSTHHKNTTYNLVIKDRNNKYQHYSVPEEVYVYVRQLEVYINNPTTSLILHKYPERFKT